MSGAAISTLTDEPALSTTAEIAECLREHPNTIRRLAAEGRLPHYRIGTKYLFDLSEIKEATRRGVHSETQIKMVRNLARSKAEARRLGISSGIDPNNIARSYAVACPIHGQTSWGIECIA